jgi:hypothetical protein
MNLKNLYWILLFLSLSSCAKIEIPNVAVCADLDQGRGLCVETLTGNNYEVLGTEWKNYSKRALKMSPEAYGEIKALILKLCKKDQSCDFNQTQKVFDTLEVAL